MANLKKYDPRVDDLVVETQTLWAPEVSELTAEDRRWLAKAIHSRPQDASTLEYERTHTGFKRIITVTVADVERLYQSRVSA